jgi:hypothetical protein
MPRLDLNFDGFLRDWFIQEKPEQLAVLKTLAKLRQMTWDEVYKDHGLNWELAREHRGERFYSLRVTQRCRALVQRSGDFVVFVSLHPDHDSAYR